MRVALDTHDLTIHRPEELYKIMQAVLYREAYFDKHKEHAWAVALDHGRTILNIEHLSTGTTNSTFIEPAEVLSVPLQKMRQASCWCTTTLLVV